MGIHREVVREGLSKGRAQLIAVIVVNFGTAALIERYHHDIKNLFVVDNYKSRQDREDVRAVCKVLGASLVELEKNIGFGAGVDVGVASAKEHGFTEFLVVNPDLRIAPPDVATLHKVLLDNREAMVSPVIKSPDGRTWFEGSVILRWRGMARHAPWSPASSIPWLTGACLGFTLEQWEELGGLGADYFLYWEDVDFTYRWRNAGGRLIVDRNVTAYHDVGGSQEGDGKSLLYTRMVSRNRKLFARRNLTRMARARWWFSTPVFVLSLVKNANHKGPVLNARHFVAAIQGATDSTESGTRR